MDSCVIRCIFSFTSSIRSSQTSLRRRSFVYRYVDTVFVMADGFASSRSYEIHWNERDRGSIIAALYFLLLDDVWLFVCSLSESLSQRMFFVVVVVVGTHGEGSSRKIEGVVWSLESGVGGGAATDRYSTQ